jgi:hypothetical protein
MEDGGYQLPPDDRQVFEANFDIAIQQKQATEVEDVMDRHYR